ncbi:MAG: GYF domain-containing protein [Pirellulales bacterium]
MAGTEWFCKIGNTVHGPFEAGQLRQLAQSGRLGPDDFVRKGAGGQWVKAIRVTGLVAPTPQPEPQPARSLVQTVKPAKPVAAQIVESFYGPKAPPPVPTMPQDSPEAAWQRQFAAQAPFQPSPWQQPMPPQPYPPQQAAPFQPGYMTSRINPEKLGWFGILMFALLTVVMLCYIVSTRPKSLLEETLEQTIEKDKQILEEDIRVSSITDKMRDLEDKIQKIAERLERGGYREPSEEEMKEWNRLESQLEELREARRRIKSLP